MTRWPAICARGATVILESTTYPGHHRGAGGARSSRRAPGLVAGTDFFLGYSPERIDPGNPVWDLDNTPKVVSGIDAASLAAVQAFYDTIVDTHRARLRVQGGRAHQAAREHLPPRQHRPGQRAGHVRRRPRHRHLGVHRRRLHQAVRLHALHARARASAATACPSTRATSRGGSAGRSGQPFRFVELANDINDHMPDYVVRRLTEALNRRRQAVNGSRILLLGAGLQAQHRRRPRVTGRGGGRAPARPRRRGAGRRSPRHPATTSTAPSSGSRSPPRSWPRADAVILLTDHDAFDLDAGAHPRPLRARHPPAGAGRRQVEYLSRSGGGAGPAAAGDDQGHGAGDHEGQGDGGDSAACWRR